MNMKPLCDHRQQGVAILMVLMVITVMAGLLYPLWQSQRVSMTRMEASQAQLQSWAVLISAQDWIKTALRFDAESSTSDNLLELWAQPMPPVPFDGGLVGGRLVDAQGRLNVNRLAIADERNRQLLIGQFNRLCQSLSLDCPFWSAVADWIDLDDNPMQGGAEASLYQSEQRTPPTNQPFLLIEEMRQVIGVTPEIITKLKPYLIALPNDTGLNINTASEPVLRSLGDWMTPDMAAQLIAKQQTQPFENNNSIDVELQKIGAPADALTQLQFSYPLISNTQYFLLEAFTDYNHHRWFMHSLVKRDAGKVVTMGRWLTEDMN